MERQLKERLIGAAVLVAVAVVMVPEMFSGPHPHSEPANASSAGSGQIKTYHIELQSAHSAEAAAPVAVEAPAAQPRDEAPAADSVVPTSDAVSAASSAGVASTSSAIQRADTQPAAVVAKPAATPAAAPLPAPNKTVPATKPAEGDWTVQVGSFATQDKARQIVGKLKEHGYPAYLGKVTVAGKTLYRVRVGAAPTRAAAESTLQKLKATYPGASVVPANR